MIKDLKKHKSKFFMLFSILLLSVSLIFNTFQYKKYQNLQTDFGKCKKRNSSLEYENHELEYENRILKEKLERCNDVSIDISY